jgi:hypothetical protein
MSLKLVSKKELKTVDGIPYSFAHIARLETAGRFPQAGNARTVQGRVAVRGSGGLDRGENC